MGEGRDMWRLMCSGVTGDTAEFGYRGRNEWNDSDYI